MCTPTLVVVPFLLISFYSHHKRQDACNSSEILFLLSLREAYYFGLLNPFP